MSEREGVSCSKSAFMSAQVLSEVDVARRAQTATERDLLAAQRAAETEYLQRRDMTLQVGVPWLEAPPCLKTR